MMMNFEKSVKTCFAVGMVLISTCAAAATTQFTKGKSWLSKNTYYPTQTQNAAPTNPSGRTKLMAVSDSHMSGGYRVFDITIAMYKDRTERERTDISFIITNFAYAVYEATDGKHKIGKVSIFNGEFDSFSTSANIIWREIGWPQARVHRREDPGEIYMFDIGANKNERTNYLSREEYMIEAGFLLAHEWGHAAYGLYDEYEKQRGDIAVEPSIMTQPRRAIGDGRYGDFSWLNFSIADTGIGIDMDFRDTIYNEQHRVYGQSGWEQLVEPLVAMNHATTPAFPEFVHHDVISAPTIEFDVSNSPAFAAAQRSATSELEIIWEGVKSPVVMVSIDTSGSMGTSDMSNVKDRAQEILSRVSEGTVVGVSTFTTSVSEVIPLTRVTEENRATLKAKIATLPSSGSGGTDIWDAAWDGLEQIATYDPQKANAAKTTLMANALTATAPVTAHNYGAASLILLTDGENGSSSHSKAQVIARCNEMGVAFNSIGYGSNADKSLRDVSDGTGGQYFPADQGGNSLSEAFLRQLAYSSFRVALADYSCTSVAQQTFSHSFFVDSTLTNVIMNVVLSRATADDVVQFIAPDGTVYSGERTETSTGVTYAYRAASCAVGEWTVTASVGKDVETTIYADADSVGDDMRVNGAISDGEPPKLVVSIDAMHSITGAQVTACVPCDGFVREVPFEENGYGCYSLDLVRCGAEAAKNGLTVRCDIRKGEAYVNYDDGLVSPALDEGSESVKESKTRVVHFTPDELKGGFSKIKFNGATAVSGVNVTSRWPFNGKVDIDCSLLTFDPGLQSTFTVMGYDRDLNRNMVAKTVSGDGAVAAVMAGQHRLTWDVVADYPDFHSSAFAITVSANPIAGTSYGDALEVPVLQFESGGDSLWETVDDGSASGGKDVVSGALSAGQTSWLETTVVGPGRISFYWRTAGEANLDVLSFAVDGAERAKASGPTEWRQVSVNIPSGEHVLRWTYAKNSAGNQDGAWLDRVEWTEMPAAVESTYMVIDLSGGANATTYPVSYLDDVPSGGWTDEYKTTKLVLRRITSGSFMMGSPTDELGRSGDEALHPVTIGKPFFIGIFEVTQKQYEFVMGANPSYYTRDMRPTECVSYNMIRGSASGGLWPASNTVDSTCFMGKIRAKTGLLFDLPTEAQWEYACRAGTTSALNDGNDLVDIYNDSNMDNVGCHLWNHTVNKGGYVSGPKNVGSYLPNSWGLYDMHGNVREWCLDWYEGSLGELPITDPAGAVSGSCRVMRGGSWLYPAQRCRSSARFGDDPSYGETWERASPVSSTHVTDRGFRISCSSGKEWEMVMLSFDANGGTGTMPSVTVGAGGGFGDCAVCFYSGWIRFRGMGDQCIG